jgi:hypothetical protein
VYFGKVRGLSPMLGWSLPVWMMMLVLLPGFLLVGVQRLGVSPELAPLRLASINLLVLVLPFYLFQGFLVTQWNLLSRGIPSQVTWVGWAVLVFFLGPLIPGAAAFLILDGIHDTWFDLRRLNPPAQPADGPSSDQ